ncbi:hypothetical protein BVC80_1477g31 [Macleaya cordata]|uniref:Epidermal growth factor-like domain n=1 Tax=Macleaya cordata TaxID=56857 RepID=A0A200PZA3_MACCD|nr:hypothetical protein BVC80_1477g31 [Macleaya cordata]
MAGRLVNVVAILAVVFLVVQPISASINDELSPFAAPYLDALCKEVECGKGTCKASLDYTFNYMCECEAGWKRSRFQDEEDLKFLPCVIPNCTLDYSCGTAPPPAPEIKEPPKNSSFYDPCYYAYCGEGSCTKSLRYGHKCECKQGFTNLLNITAFPCYDQCVLGSDCARLGITVAKNTANNTSTSSSNNSGNHASSSLPGSFVWLTILIMSVAMVPRT